MCLRSQFVKKSFYQDIYGNWQNFLFLYSNIFFFLSSLGILFSEILFLPQSSSKKYKKIKAFEFDFSCRKFMSTYFWFYKNRQIFNIDFCFMFILSYLFSSFKQIRKKKFLFQSIVRENEYFNFFSGYTFC